MTMLSKKQLWRKVISSPRPIPRTDIDQNGMDISNETIVDSNNRQNSPVPGVTPRKLRSAMSLSNLSEMEKLLRPKEQRNIRFSATVHVCLIPTRQEMKMTIDELFWKPCDYNTFKTEAVAELKALLTSHGLTPKQAITQLYQPNDQDREEYNKMILENNRDFKFNTIDGNEKMEMEMEIDSNPSKVKKLEADNQQLEIKFITAIKTDVELNENSIACSPNKTSNLPTHTPSGGQQSAGGHVWTVNWKKSESGN